MHQLTTSLIMKARETATTIAATMKKASVATVALPRFLFWLFRVFYWPKLMDDVATALRGTTTGTRIIGKQRFVAIMFQAIAQ